MKILLVVVLAVFVVLTACVADPYNRYDPYSSAQGSRMTADAALQLAQMHERAMTATAQAPIVHITETAAALSVMGTQAAGTSTAAIQTQSGAMTATAMYLDGTATVAALNAQGTMIANNLERDRLALEREQIMNDFNAKVSAYSWVILVLIIAAAMMWISRKMRYQPMKVDARGNVLPILDIVEGEVTDPDRMPNYRGPASEKVLTRLLVAWIEKKYGLRPLLPEITAERQDMVTQMDQVSDIASRGLPAPAGAQREQKKLATQAATKLLPAQSLESRFKILNTDAPELEIVDAEIIQVLDNEWKEAQKK